MTAPSDSNYLQTWWQSFNVGMIGGSIINMALLKRENPEDRRAILTISLGVIAFSSWNLYQTRKSLVGRVQK